jgi:hypothetical protein
MWTHRFIWSMHSSGPRDQHNSIQSNFFAECMPCACASLINASFHPTPLHACVQKRGSFYTAALSMDSGFEHLSSHPLLYHFGLSPFNMQRRILRNIISRNRWSHTRCFWHVLNILYFPSMVMLICKVIAHINKWYSTMVSIVYVASTVLHLL